MEYEIIFNEIKTLSDKGLISSEATCVSMVGVMVMLDTIEDKNSELLRLAADIRDFMESLQDK